MPEKEFVNGLIYKEPKNAPEFVLANISIKKEELMGWLQTQHKDWINIDIKRSKKGKCYAEVNTWEPNKNYSKTTNTPPTTEQPQNTGIDEEIAKGMEKEVDISDINL